jgi:hypothetical protein
MVDVLTYVTSFKLNLINPSEFKHYIHNSCHLHKGTYHDYTLHNYLNPLDLSCLFSLSWFSSWRF